MKLTNPLKYLLALAAFSLSIFMVSCENDDPGEKVEAEGDRIEDATDGASDAVEEAGDEIEDKTDEAD